MQANVPVNGSCGDVAVASIEMYAARDILSNDVAVAGLDIEVEFAGNVQFNLDGFVPAAKEGKIEMRDFHADHDVIAVLAFFDAHFAGTDFVPFGDDVGVNLFLIGAYDGDVAIVSGDSQVGAGADLISLGPVVCAHGRCGGLLWSRQQGKCPARSSSVHGVSPFELCLTIRYGVLTLNVP